jgi:predicted transcriptional regulator of viral defense system
MAGDKISRLLSADTPFFTTSSLQVIFEASRESTRTIATRLVKRGVLTRIRRDLYALINRKYSLFSLANALCQPSVVSLESALNYWGLIVQVPQIVFSTALKSYQYQVENTTFVYRRIAPPLMRFGQVKVEDFYIADPEKAFLDSLYMRTKGLVELLPEDVNMGSLDTDILTYYGRFYPDRVRELVRFFRKQNYEAK